MAAPSNPESDSASGAELPSDDWKFRIWLSAGSQLSHRFAAYARQFQAVTPTLESAPLPNKPETDPKELPEEEKKSRRLIAALSAENEQIGSIEFSELQDALAKGGEIEDMIGVIRGKGFMGRTAQAYLEWNRVAVALQVHIQEADESTKKVYEDALAKLHDGSRAEIKRVTGQEATVADLFLEGGRMAALSERQKKLMEGLDTLPLEVLEARKGEMVAIRKECKQYALLLEQLVTKAKKIEKMADKEEKKVVEPEVQKQEEPEAEPETKNPEGPKVSWRARLARKDVRDAKTTQAALNALKDSDASVQLKALYVLKKAPSSPEITQAALNALKDSDADVRYWALEVLQEAPSSPEITQAAFNALKDSDADVRLVALYVLKKAPSSPEITQAALNALRDSDADMRLVALYVLQEAPSSPEITLAALNALKDSDADVRYWALYVLKEAPSSPEVTIEPTTATKEPSREDEPSDADVSAAEGGSNPFKVPSDGRTGIGGQAPIKVAIPGGTFEMGSTRGRPDEMTREGTTRTVTLSPYQLAKTETTVGQYAAYLNATEGSTLLAVVSGCGSDGTRKMILGNTDESIGELRRRVSQVAETESCPSFTLENLPNRTVPDFSENRKGDQYPVVGLTFDEKQTFCQYYGGDLPTAAQVERAAKGRSGTDPHGTPIAKAVHYVNGYDGTAPVCGPNDERANNFGICDLAGNVQETTGDAYDGEFYDRMLSQDPHNSLTGQETPRKVELRGGSWTRGQGLFRSTFRYTGDPVVRDGDVGFRCAWPQDSEPHKEEAD